MRFTVPIIRSLVLPNGATTGQRIVIDGVSGTITMYDAGNNVTGQWSASGQSFTIWQGGTAQAAHVILESTTPNGDAGILLNSNTALWDTDAEVGASGTAPQVPRLRLVSPRNAGIGTTAAELDLDGGANGGLPGPRAGLSVDLYATLSGVYETWKALPLTNGWSNKGATWPAAQYRRVSSPPFTLEVIGRVSHAAVTGTSQLATALGGNYIPLHANDVHCTPFGNSASPVQTPVLSIDNTGVLSFFNLPTGTTDVAFHALFSLDA